MPKTYPTPVPPPARSGNPQELEEQTRTRRAYLEALRAGATELPPNRRNAEQRRLHDANLTRLTP